MVTAFAKILYFHRFQDVVGAMELFPARAARIISWILPSLELACANLLFIGWWPHVGAALVIGLLLAFISVLVLYRLRGGKELVCGCFADYEHKTTTSSLIVRDLALLAAGVPWLAGMDRLPRKHSSQEWGIALTIVLGVVLGSAMLSRLVEIIGKLRLESRERKLQEEF